MIAECEKRPVMMLLQKSKLEKRLPGQHGSLLLSVH